MPGDAPARVVSARHDACSAETRVRLPRHVPARAVRRVTCGSCAVPFEVAAPQDLGVEAVAAEAPSPPLPPVAEPEPVAAAPEPAASPEAVPLVTDPSPRRRLPDGLWRWASLPLAALAVFAILQLTQGSDEPAPAEPAPSATPDTGSQARTDPRPQAGARGAAQLVDEATFQLALPAGWQRIEPEGGATFAAVAPGGEADATLWVQRDPSLTYMEFEKRSLAQVESLAGSAEFSERSIGPTAETSTTKIAPVDPPKGAPRLEVLLRASGRDYYYLATTVQPGSSAATVEAARLIQGSLVPKGEAR